MKKKILAIFMAIMSTVLVFGSCGTSSGEKKEDPIPANAPDYSDSKLQFDFYGYSSTCDGTWRIDGVEYSAGQDYRTLERVQEYKDAGMTIFFPQVTMGYWGQEYETSETKKALDYSLEVGLKCILNDTRIQSLSKREKPVIGSELEVKTGDKRFIADEDDLDAVIAEYMEPYRYHDAFYGLMLGDEPFHYHAESYGQIYRSLKRVAPDCFIQYNLNPITAGVGINNAEGDRNIDVRFPQLKEGDEGYGEDLTEDEELIARYRAYLRLFMDKTGADFIQYDQYPFRHADKVDEYYFLGLQVVAELAKEYDAKFYFVTQTYGQTDGVPNPRMLSEADLYWMNNMLMGFGIEQISYFTYFTKVDNNIEHFIDGNSFITWYGEKTDIYYWMQQIMAEEQKLAPTILNFDYTTSKIILNMPTLFNSSYAMRTLETADFTALKNVEINKEVALVTELYDEKKDNYMYMVQNVIDSTKKGSKAFQTTTLTFDEKYTHVMMFVKGEKSFKKLEEGKLVLKHKPGEATYVIPF